MEIIASYLNNHVKSNASFANEFILLKNYFRTHQEPYLTF